MFSKAFVVAVTVTVQVKQKCGILALIRIRRRNLTNQKHHYNDITRSSDVETIVNLLGC